jgi:Glucodextranase, domain B/PASTA domain
MSRLAPRALFLLCIVPVLAGCGQGSHPPQPPVRLTIDSPADGAHLVQEAVDVSGSVSSRAARVLVRGRRVPVTGRTFSTRVRLAPGANVLDVLASAPDARPAMSAVRVYRQVTIAVPDLAGERPSEAAAKLASQGLGSKIVNSGGPLEFLVPAERKVCKTDPPAGRQVPPGTAIRVLTAKLC